jgi:type I restriction enzyme S subunit
VETFSTLGPHIRLQTGKLDANAQVQGGKYPFFTCSRTALQIDTYSYDCECVLLSGNGDFHSRYYEGKFDAYQRLYVIESADKSVLSVSYLHKFMLLYSKELEKLSGGGVIQYIKKGHITDAQIRIPPLAEQKRIVARVDQLMALIDQLEAKQNRKREVGARFTKASLEALTTAEGPQEFTAAWTRIHSTWPTLLDSAEKVPGLRRLVLDVATKGLLVQPKPGEDAKNLLGQIGADVPQVAPEDAPFGIPSHWTWMRLGSLGTFLGGGTPSKNNLQFWKGNIPWVSPKDMKRLYIDDAEDHISAEAVDSSATKLIPSPSLLMVLRGMILAHSFPVALTTKTVTINQDMKALVLRVPAMAEYALLACRAARDRVLAKVQRSSHGTCRLESEDVANLPIPMPPLAEQKRIVAKVEQLMKLCDTLEAALRRSEDRAAKLVEAVVQEMVA